MICFAYLIMQYNWSPQKMHDALIPQRFSKSLTVIPVLPPQAQLYPVAMRIVAVIAAFAAAQASFLESTGPGPLDLTKLAYAPTGPSGTEKELRYWFGFVWKCWVCSQWKLAI